MSNLQSLIDGYVQRHGSSYRAICERLGWSHGTISSWFKRVRTSPPTAVELRALAVQIQTPYKTVLKATLLDYGYLPEEGQAHGNTPAKKSPDDGSGPGLTLVEDPEEVSDDDESLDPAALDTVEGLDEEPGGSDHDES